MKHPILLFVLLGSLIVGGCAHAPAPQVQTAVPDAAVSVALPGPASNTASPLKASADSESADDDDLASGEEGLDEAPPPTIADPIEPFNRAMYHFNDKLYFWVTKPVAQGYKAVVPEEARLGVKNFFTNLAFPIRFVNCLLQAELGGATIELGRFVINTVWGIGGLFDAASIEGIDLRRQEKDLGQTLGIYGVGQGFYINWPILGPSSPRDTIGTVGDFFLSPTTYVGSGYAWTGVKAWNKLNDVTFRIGDYEALKEAAIDPYVAIRDAYVQHRMNMIKKANPGKP